MSEIKISTIVDVWLNNEHVWQGNNLIVTTGLRHIADQLAKTSDESAMNIIRLGSGTTPPTPGDTDIETIALNAAFDPGYPQQMAAPDETKIQYKATVSGFAPFPNTYTEAGIMNADATRVLFNRVVFTPVVLNSVSDTFTILFTMSFSS